MLKTFSTDDLENTVFINNFMDLQYEYLSVLYIFIYILIS